VRYFNTTGPCVPDLHYMLPPERLLPGARALIEGGQYFVVQGPPRTGRTTALSALARDLTAGARHIALRLSPNEGPVARGGHGAAEQVLLSAIRRAAEDQRLPPEWMPPDPWPIAAPGRRILRGLRDWSVRCPRPLVLLLDFGASGMMWDGESSISLLRQLRDGFSDRPGAFPASIVLCGPDPADARRLGTPSGDDPSRLETAGPLGLWTKSVTVGNFTFGDVQALYRQHTEESGQQLTPEAVERAFGYTQGQPWLVNALAREVTGNEGVEPSVRITAGHVNAAKERLVRAVVSDFVSTTSTNSGTWVRRILESLVALTPAAGGDSAFDDDECVSLMRDLGVIAADDPLRIANPIYQEVIARILESIPEEAIIAGPPSLVLPDGRLDLPRLMDESTRATAPITLSTWRWSTRSGARGAPTRSRSASGNSTATCTSAAWTPAS